MFTQDHRFVYCCPYVVHTGDSRFATLTPDARASTLALYIQANSKDYVDIMRLAAKRITL